MRTNSDAPLLLFFASRGIGGGEAYFINLGLSALKAGRRCVVVDYSDGYVISRLPGAEHVHYSDEAGGEFFGDCVAFMPLGAVTFLGNKLRLSPEAKVLLVSIHHHHAIELGNFGWLLRKLSPRVAGLAWPLLEPLRYRTVRRFFKGICRLKGLVYCAPFQRDFDEAYLRTKLDAEIVPIPLSKSLSVSPDVARHGEAIVWVSRFAKEKADIIDEIIVAIRGCERRHRLILIGEGPELERLKISAAKAGIEVEMPGVIAGPELAHYLQIHALICIGVGTAAAEMAFAGLPTLVAGLPGSFSGRYLWFHDANPGDTILTGSSSGSAITLSTALALASREAMRHQLAASCVDAASRRHDIDRSWASLAVSLTETSLEVRNLLGLAKMNQQPYRFVRRFKTKIRSMIGL